MFTRLRVVVGLYSAMFLFSVSAYGQATKPAAPEVAALADPAANALQSYLVAQRAGDLPAIRKIIHLSAADKKEYSEAVLSFQLWSRYFERKAIEKFGKEQGLSIQGHARSYDDQHTLDMKRVRDANVQYNADRSAATIYLRVELNRPENLQIDRFEFLDVYQAIKVGEVWKLDFLKTYKCVDPEQEDTYKSELAAFPRMAKVCSDLSDQIKHGTIKTADELKGIFDDKWSHVYDDPIRHVLKPGDTMPADAKEVKDPKDAKSDPK